MLTYIKDSNTSCKLSKTIKQTEKVSQVSSHKSSKSPLYKGKKIEKFLDTKITKRYHAFKDYSSSYNHEILNSFNPELQFEVTECAFKNKLIELLPELKGFKFVTALVLEFKKKQSDDKTVYNSFYWNSKAEKIINKTDINDYLNQSILQLYQTCKNL